MEVRLFYDTLYECGTSYQSTHTIFCAKNYPSLVIKTPTPHHSGTPLGTSPPLGISPTMSGEIDKIPIGGLASSADVKPPALLENTYQAKGVCHVPESFSHMRTSCSNHSGWLEMVFYRIFFHFFLSNRCCPSTLSSWRESAF